MTTKTDEQERRDFEAWHERLYGRRPVLSIKYGGYQATAHQDRWRVWQARAALQEQTAMPADAEDAARYRWLKANIQQDYVLPGGYYIHDEDTHTWDKTIDAARRRIEEES